LSSSTPIFIGGLIRWIVDRRLRSNLAGQNLSEAEFAAETDKSPGVLMASGYIAGGAIAGIIIAFVVGVFDKLDATINTFSEQHNPVFSGPYANALSLIPFAILIFLLYLAAHKQRTAKTSTDPSRLR
jgi:hypothetical protein